MYFGIATIVFFILFGATASPTNERADNYDQIEQEQEEEKKEQEEIAEKEVEKKEQEEIAKKE